MIAEEILIAEIEKNQNEKMRVSLHSYRGHDLVSQRVWFKANDGEWRPSNKGVSMSLKAIDEMIAALQGARERAKNVGALAA
jgi:hypothetical protein